MVEQKVQRYQCCQNRIEDREEETRRKQLTHQIALDRYEDRQHSKNPLQFPMIP